MERKKYLMLMAGGSGTRMGSAMPKQFLEISGKAILHLTLEKFCSVVPDIKVIVVLPETHIHLWRQYCLERNVAVPQTIVKGGISRFHSVRNGLEKVPDGATVAIHDGVRPLLSRGMIEKMFSMSGKIPALVPVIPCADTMRMLKREKAYDGKERLVGMHGAAPDRNVLFRVQTPQIFRTEEILDAYGRYPFTEADDDLQVHMQAGYSSTFSVGSPQNRKITFAEDIPDAKAKAEEYLKAREEGRRSAKASKRMRELIMQGDAE